MLLLISGSFSRVIVQYMTFPFIVQKKDESNHKDWYKKMYKTLHTEHKTKSKGRLFEIRFHLSVSARHVNVLPTVQLNFKIY